MNGFDLHLMRHGAPERAGLLLGHSDASPTQSGIVACLEKGAVLDVDCIVASDLARAAKAAQRIAADLALPLRIDPRWRELDFGEWEGVDPATLEQELLAAFWADPESNTPPAGESWSALRKRVEAALADIVRTTLIVAHAGSIRAALSCLLGLDYRQCWAFDLPYGALISLRVWEGKERSAQVRALTG